MKISTPNKKKRIIIISAIIVLLAGAGIFAYIQLSNSKSTESVNLAPPTDEQKKAGESAKSNTVSPETINDKGNSSGSDSTSPTPSQDGSKATVSAEITAANQNDGVLQVRSLMHAVSSSATCTLTMTGPGSKTYTSSAEVQALPSSTACKGFDVPVSSLSSGNWNIEIKFSSDRYEATTTKEVTIQ